MDTVTLDAARVRALVTMPEAIAAVREAFVALHRGEFEMPVRTALRDGGFLVMPVHHRPTASAMIKSLSLNFAGRVPAIAGTVVWSELAHPRHVVADAAEVTRLRTGAATGVATDLLAPPDAATCTIIGAGGQAADQVRGVHAVRPLTRLTIVARRADPARALARLLRDELPETDIRVSSDPAEAVRAAGIVCCATTSADPLFPADAPAPHAHVNAIGAFRPTMREVPDALLRDAAVVVDDLPAILAEAGDVMHALQAGVVTRDELTELGAALDGNAPVAGGRTVFKSVGVAVQDWAIARALARRVL